uniref:Secreted protein n=1 Tax=Globodera pallida TaxID=36090 RepID=A0A183CEM6_GLOPA
MLSASSNPSRNNSSSPSQLRLLFCLLIVVQALENVHAALLLPLESTLFARSNAPYALSVRRTPFPFVALSDSISREFVEIADRRKEQQSLGQRADLSRKRSPQSSSLLLDKDKFDNKQIIGLVLDQFGLLRSPHAISTNDQTATSAVDQTNISQCFCCRAFVCRKQICPCSKFLI